MWPLSNLFLLLFVTICGIHVVVASEMIIPKESSSEWLHGWS
jgi:hypothetical protein